MVDFLEFMALALPRCKVYLCMFGQLVVLSWVETGRHVQSSCLWYVVFASLAGNPYQKIPIQAHTLMQFVLNRYVLVLIVYFVAIYYAKRGKTSLESTYMHTDICVPLFWCIPFLRMGAETSVGEVFRVEKGGQTLTSRLAYKVLHAWSKNPWEFDIMWATKCR